MQPTNLKLVSSLRADQIRPQERHPTDFAREPDLKVHGPVVLHPFHSRTLLFWGVQDRSLTTSDLVQSIGHLKQDGPGTGRSCFVPDELDDPLGPKESLYDSDDEHSGSHRRRGATAFGALGSDLPFLKWSEPHRFRERRGGGLGFGSG